MTRPTIPPRIGPKLVTGLLLILAGAMLLLRNTGILNHDVWHLFWPTALILFGLGSLASRGPLHLGGHILLFFGTCFLVAQLGHEWIPDTWWPLGFVWIGVVVVLKALLRPATPAAEVPSESCEDAMRGRHE